MSERVYLGLVENLSGLLEAARRASARAVNAVITATYWEIGRRIVEFEQGGEERAEYGKALMRRLSADLTRRFGRGFSVDNLESMRRFYRAFPGAQISETLSRKSRSNTPLEAIPAPGIRQTLSGESSPEPAPAIIRQTVSAESGQPTSPSFPLPWSHYVLLLGRSRSPEALAFYHAEALRGGWSVRQLDRQIATQFYERTALSKNKAAMLKRGAVARAEDGVTADEEIKDPLVLEFLDLKDEYSELELEEALIRHLESFLLELGGELTFVGRQKRLRIGDAWYRIDLLFFHRRLRCLVIIDLKVGKFTPADAGQMNVYLNYAREHWTQTDENPPIGLILSAQKNEALARYALEGLASEVLAREYRLVLPDEERIAKEIGTMRKRWESRKGRAKSKNDLASETHDNH